MKNALKKYLIKKYDKLIGWDNVKGVEIKGGSTRVDTDRHYTPEEVFNNILECSKNYNSPSTKK